MGWGLPLFEISQGIPILRYQKTSKMAVSFSFSAYFPNTEILETRINPRFFALVLGQGFIFVQPSQRQAAAPKSRTSFLWGALFFVPALCSGHLFCQHFSGGKLPLLRRELHFCEVRAFSCPRLWFQALPPSAEVIGSFPRLFLFFAVPSEPKSLGSLIYEPFLPQKRWFSKRDAASRGSCISFS